KLGCNMTVAKDDAVYLVLWFKQGLVPPIYSYDVREVPAGKHWYDSEVLDNRASFHPHTRSSTRISGPGAHLFLKHLKQSDGGVYKCRVDFQKAPTMITRVNLTVITPPTRVELTQQNERVATVLGPVREAANITVTCTAYDGIPTPRIEWHLDGELLRDDQNLDPNNIRAMRLKSGAQFKYS
ncbi:CD80-like immunoglobulin C2-set, partial [Trinorchestia longiramus]